MYIHMCTHIHFTVEACHWKNIACKNTYVYTYIHSVYIYIYRCPTYVERFTSLWNQVVCTNTHIFIIKYMYVHILLDTYMCGNYNIYTSLWKQVVCEIVFHHVSYIRSVDWKRWACQLGCNVWYICVCVCIYIYI